MKKTITIRVYETSWKRLKILAATKSVSLVKLLEEISLEKHGR